MAKTRPKEGTRPRPVLERLLLGARARFVVAPALIAVLVLLLSGYGKMVAAADPSLVVFQNSPRQFVGKPFTTSFGKVVRLSESGFRLRRYGAAIDVVFDDAGVSVGEIVSVRGLIRPDLRLEGRELRIHRGRRIKWLLGGSVLILSLVVAGREARRDA